MSDLKMSVIKNIFELHIIVIVAITFFYGLTVARITGDSTYLSDQYTKNWNTSYITDIKLSSSIDCPTGYDAERIGVWSGFAEDSCLCFNSYTNYHAAGDSKAMCDYYRDELLLTCRPIPATYPRELFSYKNKVFCVKRANDNFHNLFEKAEDYLGPLREKKDDDRDNILRMQQFVAKANSDGLRGKIDGDAIIDIRIVDTNLYPLDKLKSVYKYDLTNYEKMEIGDDYYMFIKRFSQEKKELADKAVTQKSNNGTVFDVNKLITSIHLFNELWCGYLDISSPVVIPASYDFFSFGYFDYCQSFGERFEKKYGGKDLFYNDGFKRTKRINFDFDHSLSLSDFYVSNNVYDYYSSWANNLFKQQFKKGFPRITPENTFYGNFEPSLVYENYFHGIGCDKLLNTDDHIAVMKRGYYLQRLSYAFAVFAFFESIFTIIYFCTRSSPLEKGRCGCYIFLISIIFFISIVNFLISFAYGVTAWSARKYLFEFFIHCQQDYSMKSGNNGFKTNYMEMNYFNDMYWTLGIMGGLCFALFYMIVVMCCYSFMLCKERKPQGNSIENPEVVHPARAQDNNAGAMRGDFNQIVDDKSMDKNQI